MGVGQVISDTFGTVKARFGQMLGLWAIYFGITIGLFIVFAIGMATLGMASLAALSESNPFAVGGGFVVFLVLFYLGYLLVAMAQYASLIQMASPMDRPTTGDALSGGWRSAPALLLLLVVLALGYFAAALVFGVVGAALSATSDAVGMLLTVLLVAAIVWLACRLFPLFAVVAVDGVRNPFAAIARSWRLTRGHALTIFLALLVFVVILVVVCGLALLPSFGLLASMAEPGFAETEAALASGIVSFFLLLLGLLVVSVLYNLLYCAFIAVVHGALAGAAGEGVAESFA